MKILMLISTLLISQMGEANIGTSCIALAKKYDLHQAQVAHVCDRAQQTTLNCMKVSRHVGLLPLEMMQVCHQAKEATASCIFHGFYEGLSPKQIVEKCKSKTATL